METTEFNWERREPLSAAAALSRDDIEQMARLMAELKELTQSRGTWTAASEFLKRFGYDGDATALVRPERLAT
jgi:hypothetical protein